MQFYRRSWGPRIDLSWRIREKRRDGIEGTLDAEEGKRKCNFKYLVVISSLWYEDTSMWRFFLHVYTAATDGHFREPTRWNCSRGSHSAAWPQWFGLPFNEAPRSKEVGSIASTPAHIIFISSVTKGLAHYHYVLCKSNRSGVLCGVCVVRERERERGERREGEREREREVKGKAVLNILALRIELKDDSDLQTPSKFMQAIFMAFKPRCRVYYNTIIINYMLEWGPKDLNQQWNCSDLNNRIISLYFEQNGQCHNENTKNYKKFMFKI